MKKFKLIIAITTLLIAVNTNANSQVLITLLLGDKLNSPNLEFGLEGGINFLDITNTPDAKNLTNWNLGFYFDFKLNKKLFIHTGVLVKSKMGASGLAPYPLTDSTLNSAFVGGTVDRKLNYFNVPVLLRYRIINYLHVEGGIQLGLRYTGYDIFTNGIYNDKDLQFKNDIKDNFTRLDAGGVLGVGYKLNKGEGMTISAKYYYGFVDVDKITEGSQYNTAFYINLSIPIGKGKAEKKAKENTNEKK